MAAREQQVEIATVRSLDRYRNPVSASNALDIWGGPTGSRINRLWVNEAGSGTGYAPIIGSAQAVTASAFVRSGSAIFPAFLPRPPNNIKEVGPLRIVGLLLMAASRH